MSNELHVVAHRLPVEWNDAEGWVRAPGGLAAAVGPALSALPRSGDRPVVWHGHWSDPLADPSELAAHDGVRLAPLWIGEHDRSDALDGFANRTLWPALHGMADRIEQHEAWWAAWAERSELTARILAGRIGTGATVWIHDYQHFGLPAALRRRRPDLRLVLSCHTPIDTDRLAALDHGVAIAGSIAACDVVGTQTEADAMALRGWLLELGRFELPSVVAAPVGFDVERWRGFRDDPLVDRRARRLRPTTGALVVGVARADYTKGLIESLSGLERQLDDGALHPDELRLVQIAVPTRTAIPAFASVSTRLRALATRITERHPRSDGTSVIEVIEDPVPPREVAAWMRAADVALVPSIRDGMNLVALEFSVVTADRGSGIVLGRGAGAAEVIGEHCELVDGADADAIGRTLRRSVRSRQRDLVRSQLRSMAAEAMTVEAWVGALFARLDARSVPPRFVPDALG